MVFLLQHRCRNIASHEETQEKQASTTDSCLVNEQTAATKLWGDSETDELLLAAVDRACVQMEDYTTTSKDPIKVQSIHKETSVDRPKTNYRQRTLIEMLDEAYSHRSGPASKKHCANTPLSSTD